MSRFVDTSMVDVHLEESRLDVWVPDGLAFQQRPFPANGLPLVPGGNVLMLNSNMSVVRSNGNTVVNTLPETTRGPITLIQQDSSGEVTVYNDRNLGPLLWQSKVPVPVTEGMRVNMRGTFSVRRSGRYQEVDAGIDGRNIRVELWATGTTVDEYGVSTPLQTALMAYEAQLQIGTTTPGMAFVTFVLPTVSDAVVPAFHDRLHMAASYVSSYTKTYAATNYPAPIPGSADRLTFSEADPVRIIVRQPPGVQTTVANPASTTGFAYRNRAVFENTVRPVEVTLVGAADTTAPVTIYQRTASGRGAQLAVVPALASAARTTVVVASPTGAIELASAGAWYVESVRAVEVESETIERTRTTEYGYRSIIGDVAEISTESVEADLGILTLVLRSDAAVTEATAGKRVRLIGRHSGSFTTVFTGHIRGRRIVPGLNGTPHVQLSIHDDDGALAQSPIGLAYRTFAEYAWLLNRTGIRTVIDGVDVTGPNRPRPDGWDFFPSYRAEGLSAKSALLLTRNTNKAYYHIDRNNRVVVSSTLPTTVKLDLSDTPGQGDMSYLGDLEISSDTEDVINTVQVAEHMLDAEDFNTREVSGGTPPQQNGDIASKTQKIDYQRQSSIEMYGQKSVTFDVVRGTGTLTDLQANNFGRNFAEWATAILDRYATERTLIRSLRLLVTRPHHIETLSRLEPLDAVVVRLRGDAQVHRIRRVEHSITPGGSWFVKLSFFPSRDQVYWLPDTPVPTLTLGDTDAGTLAFPSPALIDGGAPGDVVTAVLDGGEI